jgi:hypothetical protein
LNFRSNRDRRFSRRARRLLVHGCRLMLDGKREISAGGHAGVQFVSQLTRKLDDGATLVSRAQIGLVGYSLLIKGEHVGHHRPGIKQRY